MLFVYAPSSLRSEKYVRKLCCLTSRRALSTAFFTATCISAVSAMRPQMISSYVSLPYNRRFCSSFCSFLLTCMLVAMVKERKLRGEVASHETLFEVFYDVLFKQHFGVLEVIDGKFVFL